jgi:signal transduction histidine kinase
LIQGGSQIIAICSDITRIKELEETSQKMRAMFFSSIAHELRTPLNSIIPMIKMILSNFLSSIDDRVSNFLKIILNSSLHLQNVIEDALDMSRIENNKFTIFKEIFDIEEAVKEVA